jgi:LuxR family maltose regulon positive regulatory protein
MQQMLDTRDKHRLSPVTPNSDEANVGVDNEVIGTTLRSPPHLTLVKGGSTSVVPLYGEQRDVNVRPSPSLDEHRSTVALRGWFVQSLLLEAIVRDEVGEAAAAENALERALGVAERDRVLSPFLVDPIPELLERHTRGATAHADLISEIFDLLAALDGGLPVQITETLREPLTESETRVLRLLATDLSKREIGNELYVSVNTIKTHVKHLYAKLDVQTRRQAVERGRQLGLLTYSSRSR